MVRLFKVLLVALAFTAAILTTSYTSAQSPASTPTAAPSQTNSATATPTTTSTTDPSGSAITATTVVTTTPGALLLATPTVSPSAATSSTGTISDSTVSNQTSLLTTTIATTDESAPLQGTILANRSEMVARFFLEGETYQLSPGRSQGIDLPRDTTVLNLFDCPGDLAVNTAGCFWDPYLIQQDGFYEIYDAVDNRDQPKLMLREAGAPPTGQVWVQNRTGQTESLVFKEDVYEIQPTSVLEFPVATGVPAILYVRSCLSIDNQSACEWAPKTLDAGVYYAMVEVDVPGSQAGSTLTNIDLRPIVGDNKEPDQTTAQIGVVPSLPSIVCNVVVPALNIRSGPGLQYDIIGKVRTTDGSSVTVDVTGRSADNEWLTVAPSVAESGWINNSPSFITCIGDIVGLPIVGAPAAPAPQPAIVQSPTTDTTSDTPATDVPTAPTASEGQIAPTVGITPTEESATETGALIPDGLAMLVVNNGFQHEMRFTLDQMYRQQEGPSEFDLQPGASVSIVVFPGDLAFSASSPWNGLSSNANLKVNANESLTLWLRFELDSNGSWVFGWN